MHVCTVITPKVSSPAIWLLVSQQGFLVTGSVHTTLRFIALSYVATSSQLYRQIPKVFSNAEDSVSWPCCGVGAKPAVSVVRVMHTLKELNWPVIRCKNKHLVTTLQVQQSNSPVTNHNMKCMIYPRSSRGCLRVIFL